MTLTIKEPCPYHGDGILADMHPLYKQYPSSCPYCHGTLEVDRSIYFEHFDEPASPVDWEKVNMEYCDIAVKIVCPCGDEVFFGESESNVCSCGRVYTFSTSLKVNEDHVGDTQYLINKFMEINKR